MKPSWVGVEAAVIGWRMLPEPRIVTLLLSVWYLACAGLGARLLLVPGWSGRIDWFSPLLIVGGVLAAGACLSGQWWIERVGIILLTAAWSIRVSMIIMGPPPTVWIQATGVMGIAVLLATRVARIWGLPADPMRVRGVR